MSDKPKRGGAGRGQGRKPLCPEGHVVYTMRMSKAQREKLDRLGGAAWIRRMIDQAA